MSIRTRLLLLLLPPLITLVILISIFFYFNWYNESILIILVSAGTTLLVVSISAFLVANTISKPMQKLKNSALVIAAGDYEENIAIQGPREIVDLANTLNTMRECLQENLSRFREISAARERMYGEYECSLLLQHHMLEKVVEGYHNPHLEVRTLKVTSSKPHGLFLLLKLLSNGNTEISLSEASEKGFLGMYQLLTESLPNSKSFWLNAAIIQNTSLQYTLQNMPNPLVWSIKEGRIKEDQNGTIALEPNDLIFLVNRGFTKHFEDPNHIKTWFSKVLRHFAAEGLDLLTTMLNHELAFLAKKQHIDLDIHILCFKVTTAL